MAYPFTDIEAKWQAHWRTQGTFRTPAKVDTTRPKYYVLDMFPYPSGEGLHVGHPEGYTASDIIARYKRMRGFNVLHPMGWDAFGLPAEQYALKTGTHPKVTTERNVRRFREQLQKLGFSYDWEREVNTTDPAYYKWTQWIFKQLFERGLAYQEELPVWWCPELATTLANEEVIDGKSEVGGFPCVRRPLRQWVLKITEYADQLLEGLDALDWPDSTKEMQRNWIGRSEGAEIDFLVDAGGAGDGRRAPRLRVFTTRPDTLFGATYMVVAPEHELVDQLTVDAQRSLVAAYKEQASRKSDLERTELQKVKTGVFTGSYALNPATGGRVPIWVADYVLAGYGTGAIMAVPAQDTRDFEFAATYGLPVVRTVRPEPGFAGDGAYLGDGEIINSGFLNGLRVAQAKARMIEWLEKSGAGERRVNYKLRDWLFSRQRYWGEPFPIVFVDDTPQTVSEAELPVRLPELEEFKPSGTLEGPLATAGAWLETRDEATGKRARRETNTMPQWAGSCWYYLRFIDPTNAQQLVDPELERYWMPVDLYIGGSEHAVLHLLYARFWHKVLHAAGFVSSPEPFARLVHQGMILGELEFTLYRDTQGRAVSAEHVRNDVDTRTGLAVTLDHADEEQIEKRGDKFVLRDAPDVVLEARAFKMSKSRGNVVNPDDIIARYGADAFRLYEMFMGPLEQVKPWNTRGVEGTFRFLNRAWRLIAGAGGDERDDDADARGGASSGGTNGARRDVGARGGSALADAEPTREQLRALHAAIAKVTEDIEALRFNTAISALMELVNTAYKWPNLPRAIAEPFVLLLAPLAPHLAEELWQRLGHAESLAYRAWPAADPAYLRADVIEIPVQVNGKVRGKIQVPAEAGESEVIDIARADQNVGRHLEGQTVKRAIYVRGRIVNFVVGAP
jgi:leucyl-tRNA synthetase